ncbi:MAG: polysaccharide deacetylase family protein [Ornithinimicrobium sp.]
MLNAADTVLPGTLKATREVSHRSLWQMLPSRAARRPDGVNRLAITVDLDYQADTDALPGLVDLMSGYGAPISVASVGALVEADPAPYEYAVSGGHEIVNHTQTHPDNPVLNPTEEFWHLSSQRMTEEVGQAQDVFESHLGVRPVGFRTPHFKDHHRMSAVLQEFPELRYVSSVLASKSPLTGQPYAAFASAAMDGDSYLFAANDEVDRCDILQIPLTACPSHRWTPFCSWHGIRAGADPSTGAGMHSLGQWEHLWGRLLHDAAPQGLAVVYFDPHDLMRDAETADTFGRMVAAALDSGWQASTLSDVERAYRPVVAR